VTAPKLAVAAAIALLAGFLYIVIIALSKYAGFSNVNPFLNGVLVIVAMAVLIGAGSLTYGKNSHYARAQARIRPAQQAANRAADDANAARRAAANPGTATPGAPAEAPDPPP
jgi:hypothetical protein